MDLQEGPGLLVLLLLQAELKMVKLLLVDCEESEAGLGDSKSALVLTGSEYVHKFYNTTTKRLLSNLRQTAP